jgi:hypothetical protein
VLQTFDINNNAPLADNDDFQRDAEEILDFTVINPFGEI